MGIQFDIKNQTIGMAKLEEAKNMHCMGRNNHLREITCVSTGQVFVLLTYCFLNKNGPTPATFLFIFGLFKQTLHFLQQINEKNVHPVYGVWI